MFLIIELEIFDLCERWIRRRDLSASMYRAMELIEIDGHRDVRWNHAVVPPPLGDAIDLDREGDGNAIVREFAREKDRSSSTPTVAVENNVNVAFFAVGQAAGAFLRGIASGVKGAQDKVVGVRVVMIVECSDDDANWVLPAKTIGELDLGVAGIIVTNVAAYKTDNDVFGFLGCGTCRTAVFVRRWREGPPERGNGSSGKDGENEQNASVTRQMGARASHKE